MTAALRQRCLIHRCRNIVAKVPKHAQADYWKDLSWWQNLAESVSAAAMAETLRSALAAIKTGAERQAASAA